MSKEPYLEDQYGKEQSPILSVIVPVYNTSNLLRRCLDSICDQTYRNLEIILIDDGSTDGSEDIVDEYAQRDKRIRAVHQKNSGESNARNIALRMVTGDYYTFVDCDDWIETDMYESMIHSAMDSNADIVAASWFKEFDDHTEVMTNKNEVKAGVFDQERLLIYIYQRDSYQGFAYMWDKIYKRSMMYDEAGRIIDFPVDLAIGGDVVYLARMALNAKSAIYINKSLYHYYQRADSGCHSVDLKKRLDWIRAYFEVLTYIDYKGIRTESKPWIERFLAYHSSNVAEIAIDQKNSEVLSKCQQYMSKYQETYESKNSNYPERIIRYRRLLTERI